MRKPVVIILLALSYILYSSSLLSAENPPSLSRLLSQAKAAIIEKDFNKIVDILSPHEYDYAGNANFDYYLGTAYLEMEKYSEAIFALERAVASNPKFAGAMFELSRAHFRGKDYAESKRLFNKVLSMSPPQNIKEAVTTYLIAISTKESQYTTVHTPAIAVNIGFDNNANNSTDKKVIQGVTLADKNQETSSSYYALLVSDYYSMPIAPDWKWQSKGALYLRNNPSADFVDMQLGLIQTGVEWFTENHAVSIDLGGLQSRVAGEPFASDPSMAITNADYQTENLDRVGTFINANYLFNTESNSTFNLSAKVSKFEHEDILAVRDMTQVLLSAGYMVNFESNWQLKVKLSASKDIMEDEPTPSPYGNKRHALKVAVVNQLTSSLVTQIGIQHSQTDYDGAFFGNTRKDIQVVADWSLNWIIDQKLSYWAKVLWVDHHSSDTFDLYSYGKTAIEFGVNYQF